MIDPSALSIALTRDGRDIGAPAPAGARVHIGRRLGQSAAIAAGRLPDPTLGVGIDNFPVSGPPAFSLTEENM